MEQLNNELNLFKELENSKYKKKDELKAVKKKSKEVQNQLMEEIISYQIQKLRIKKGMTRFHEKVT